MFLLELFIRAPRDQEDTQGPPLQCLWEHWLKNSACLSASSEFLGPETPQSCLWSATTPPSPTGSHSHPFLFPCFLSTPEEDPCACESIVKFQTEVEGLLQALTRKHILPRDHCGSREGCGERRGSHV